MTYSSVVLADAPTAFYRFNETSGTSVSDSSGHANTATNSGATLNAVGPINSDTSVNLAYTFDGATSYVQCPSAVNPSGTVFSVAAWIKLANTTFTTHPRIISSAHTDVDHTGFQFFVNASGLGLTFAVGIGTTSVSVITSNTLTAGVWYYVSAVWSGSALLIYLNGSLLASTPNSTSVTAAAQSCKIGTGVAYAGDFFPGYIDEVEYYSSTALSATRLLAHYTASKAVNAVTVAENPNQTETINGTRVNLANVTETSVPTENITRYDISNYVAITEQATQTETVLSGSITVSSPTDQMQASDMAIQYARIVNSPIYRNVAYIASIYYGSTVNKNRPGELDVSLIGETVQQLHQLRTINDVTAFLRPRSYMSAVLSDYPLMYYRLSDDASAHKIIDSSGNGYNATASTSGVTYNTAGAIVGDSDTSITLDGIVGRVTTPVNTGFTALTLECWCNFPTIDASNYNRLIANDSPISNWTGFELIVAPTSDGSAAYFNYGTGSFADGINFGTTFNTNTWYHIMITYDGVVVCAYINGQLSFSVITNDGPIAVGETNIAIGYDPAFFSGFTNAIIDEVAIYSHALSATRALLHYQTGVGIIS